MVGGRSNCEKFQVFFFEGFPKVYIVLEANGKEYTFAYRHRHTLFGVFFSPDQEFKKSLCLLFCVCVWGFFARRFVLLDALKEGICQGPDFFLNS